MSFWYGENILFNNSTTDQSKFSFLILSSVHVTFYESVPSRYSHFSSCIMYRSRYIINAVSMHFHSPFTEIAQFPPSDISVCRYCRYCSNVLLNQSPIHPINR